MECPSGISQWGIFLNPTFFKNHWAQITQVKMMPFALIKRLNIGDSLLTVSTIPQSRKTRKLRITKRNLHLAFDFYKIIRIKSARLLQNHKFLRSFSFSLTAYLKPGSKRVYCR